MTDTIKKGPFVKGPVAPNSTITVTSSNKNGPLISGPVTPNLNVTLTSTNHGPFVSGLGTPNSNVIVTSTNHGPFISAHAIPNTTLTLTASNVVIPVGNVAVSTSPSVISGLALGTVDTNLYVRYQEFDRETEKLRTLVQNQALALSKEKTAREEKDVQNRALEKIVEELRAKERLSFLLSRVDSRAHRQLIEDKKFRTLFLGGESCKAFVISIDIRRSTELMLKARTPADFSRFITTLCADLMEIIVGAFGVVDKFTGDGVLAFFPDFYSGSDAGYRVVDAAEKCHASFKRHYDSFRKSFTSVLVDVGLGIGIDFGEIQIVQIDGLTVVGEPVVYACRLSGAPAGMTLLNQPAYEQISEKCGASCFVTETQQEIKHEGKMLAYHVRPNERPYKAADPDWLSR